MSMLRSVGVAGVIVFLVAGCSEERPGELPVYPVQGQGTFKGKPMSYLILTFYPVGVPLREARLSRAYADAEGRFQMTTYELNDGMPEGEYTVVLWWPEEERDPTDLETGNEPDRLKRMYNDPTKSKIRFTVKPEPNTFDIKLP